MLAARRKAEPEQKYRIRASEGGSRSASGTSTGGRGGQEEHQPTPATSAHGYTLAELFSKLKNSQRASRSTAAT